MTLRQCTKILANPCLKLCSLVAEGSTLLSIEPEMNSLGALPQGNVSKNCVFSAGYLYALLLVFTQVTSCLHTCESRGLKIGKYHLLLLWLEILAGIKFGG